MGQAALTLVAALLLAPRQPESTQSPEPGVSGVSVSFSDCDESPVGRSVFLGALALELDPHSSEPREPLGATEIAVALACDGIAQIHIVVGSTTRERAVRFDDVPPTQRARALALVVAELFRSAAREPGPAARTGADAARDGSPPASSTASTAPANDSAPKPARATSEPAAAATANVDDVADSEPEPGRARSARAVRLVIATTLRGTLEAPTPLWGGEAGVDLGLLRALAEVLVARSSVERGSITSGIGALRVGRTFEFARSGRVGLEGGASAAGGVTWTVGDSSVPGTTVQEVLAPYFDAELEMVTRFAAAPGFEPELTLYGGRASGLQATSGAKVEQATGGWFAGLRLGAAF